MDQVRSKTDADDAILSQVDQKVEEWKVTILFLITLVVYIIT